jgi:hypothetical protein
MGHDRKKLNTIRVRFSYEANDVIVVISRSSIGYHDENKTA